MKHLTTFEAKEFQVDLYVASDFFRKNLETHAKESNNEFDKYEMYFLMVKERYLQVSYGQLRDVLKKSFRGEFLDNTHIGVSLLTFDSETFAQVYIKQTKIGYKIDCLELTTEDTKQLYSQINKFIRDYERSNND